MRTETQLPTGAKHMSSKSELAGQTPAGCLDKDKQQEMSDFTAWSEIFLTVA